MTNDPEIRAAVLELYTAHVELLRAAAGLADALQAAMVVDDAFTRLAHALDAESLCLRAVAAHIEPPDVREQLFLVGIAALEGKR